MKQLKLVITKKNKLKSYQVKLPLISLSISLDLFERRLCSN